MEIVLVTAGAACLIAAAAGVTIKALNIQIEAITSGRRQLLLAVLGAGFLAGGILLAEEGTTSEANGTSTDELGTTSDASGTTTDELESSSTKPLPESNRLIRPVSAAATSTLSPQSGVTYGVRNLLDNDQTTAWCEGAGGNGINESATLTFAEPVLLRRIDIINGYNKEDRFKLNARAQNVEVVSASGRRLATLQDTSGVQHLPVPGSATTFIKLVIKSAYPGTQFADLCLTDIQFTGVPAG